MFNWIHSLFSRDLAIDLGTANTLIYVCGEGIIANEPSVVAFRRSSQKNSSSGGILAVGKGAKEMLGRTPENIVAIRPIKDGVIADFEVTSDMLRHFIELAHNRKALVKPRIVIGIPSKVTEVERRAVREAAENAGAREVFLVEQPMAAAIGAGMPISEPSGNMIVDIGGGTTDIAVISLNGIVFSMSERVGGDKMNEAIVEYMKENRELIIGEPTAEIVKMGIGRACILEDDDPQTMNVKGQDQHKYVPCVKEVSSEEIVEALKDPVANIAKTLSDALERMPPELAGDIAERGVILAGGGALLKNLAEHLTRVVGLHVTTADDPLTAVVKGAGKLLEDEDLLHRVCLD